MKVKTAVIIVAGLGTRLMPLTLHQPKAMVSVVDRPIIHYLIDELVSAGIKNFIIVHGANQESIKKYTAYLKNEPEWKKYRLNFKFTLQKELRGSANALLAAEKLVNNEPFLVYFGDDILEDRIQPAKIFMRYFSKVRTPILLLQKIPKRLSIKYAIVKPVKISKDFYKILEIEEKPKPQNAKSNLGAMGRFLLTPDIFNAIRKSEKIFRNKKEIAVADAIQVYLQSGGRVHGWVYNGRHFDCGSKIGLIQAQIYFGLKHSQLRNEFKKISQK